MAMTSEKTAGQNDYDSDGRRQLPLCELTMMEVLHSQLTPTMLNHGQVQEEGYIWEVRHMLRGDGGLVETQLGCQHHRPGSNPTPT